MDRQIYKDYYKLEREHWWFRARLVILESLLVQQKLSAPGKNNRILNAGAATGATSIMLKNHGEVVSLEFDKDCSEFLSTVLNEEVVNASLTHVPMEDKSFDLVCAFDVIEHIQDDDRAIKEIHRLLNDDGYVYITLPAFNFLWSKHDEMHHHHRRYTIGRIVKLLEDNNFEVRYKSYFNTIFFIPILFYRLFANMLRKRLQKEYDASYIEGHVPGRFLNTLLYHIFKSELSLLRRNLFLPIGVSLVVVGRKISR